MSQLTVKSVLYPLSLEGMVQEAYRDSVGVWTWAGGVTNSSGHNVTPYIDNPQPMQRCMDVTIWLMKEKYLPAVLRAFNGRELTENQLAAALSFHWNTGAIERAMWPKNPTLAGFLQWTSHGLLTDRRKSEAALFLDGVWPKSLKVPVYSVNRTTHRPKFPGTMMDLTKEVTASLA